VSAEAYLDKAITLLRDIRETQIAPIKEAGRLCSTALKGGGLIHVFGTGHSHMLAEEVFVRAGGLLPVNAVLVGELMLHEGGIIAQGPPERIRESEEPVVQRFLKGEADDVELAEVRGTG
jgi:uncharacterized phosphosugar-binding protein